jgi:hypothetical protein
MNYGCSNSEVLFIPDFVGDYLIMLAVAAVSYPALSYAFRRLSVYVNRGMTAYLNRP